MTSAVPLGELMAAEKSSLDPRKTPDESFELFSIPAFDTGEPEIVLGGEVGSSKQIVHDGDVLLSKIVPHIRRAWVVESRSGYETIGSSEWIIFRSDRFDSAYLCHALVSDRFHQAFMQTVAGIGGSLLRARPNHVAEIQIPLPPLEEQRRIAAILDAADALRTKRRQALAKLDTLSQAIFANMFGDPRMTTSWPEVTLGELANLERSSIRADDIEDGETYVGLENITNLGEFKGVRQVDAGELKSNKFRFDPSHILYGKLRPYLAKIAAPDFSGVCSTDILPVRPSAAVDHRYLLHYLRTPAMIEHASSQAVGANLPRLSPKSLEKFAIPLPPMAEQRRFARLVGRVDQLRRPSTSALDQLDNLFAALQQRAFRGEL